ncbi:MAG: putative lipid II flippase FtsW [Candidatus Moraniibacteriota bacterium]|nr:MAG: putative lipid II flippase FtsW [Candidatus Moranbacteria bacterium]
MGLAGLFKTKGESDRVLKLVLFLLLGIGLTMIASAGVSYGNVRFDDPYYFFKEQLIGLGVGTILLLICERIPYTLWQKFVIPIFLTAIGLLILVFIPGFGTTVYGAARWVDFGLVSFQPSEVMKLSIILYLAAWLSRRGERHAKDFYEGFLPFLMILMVVGFLIIKQPDTGTLGLIFCVALAIFFVSGASLMHLFGLVLGALAFLALLIKIAPYRMQRFLVFLNPEHDPLGAGYQMTQALLAIGSGGLFGVGLGHSRQKFNYLPEPVTDSIFAVLSEETGLLGVTIVLSLFVLFLWRGMRIARGAPDLFGKLLATGITAWVVCQAFINISAISGLIPLTGITLPFISFGGTSLAILMASVGILLNVSRHSTLK